MLRKTINKTRLVGGYFPQPLADEFSLYVLFVNKSRSNLIRDVLVAEMKKGPGVEKMLDAVARDFFELWQNEYKDEFDIKTYLMKVREDLERKRIAEQHIVEICTRVGNCIHDKKKK